jgi:hypothetical protein
MKLDFFCTYKNPNGPGFVIEMGNPPGRWMQAKRPTQYGMRCEGGGCQRLTEPGDWYWREGPCFILCEWCASGTSCTACRGGQEISYEIPPPPR